MKKLFKVFSLMLVVIMAFPFSVMASENDQQRSDLIGAEERDFEKLICYFRDCYSEISGRRGDFLLWER
mgnify:CR=1 FL=1